MLAHGAGYRLQTLDIQAEQLLPTLEAVDVGQINRKEFSLRSSAGFVIVPMYDE